MIEGLLYTLVTKDRLIHRDCTRAEELGQI